MTVLRSEPELDRPRRADRPGPEPASGRRRWWRRPWLVPLAVVVAAFLFYYVWRHYITFDPARAVIPMRFSLHFPILLVHIVGGTLAMVTTCLQLWPWLRRHHPRVHRISGRVYVFAGVVPTTLVTLFLIETQPQPVGPAGGAAWSAVWLTTTLIGFQAARRGRYREHRRWMIRSFALGLAIVETRVVFTAAAAIPGFTPDPVLLAQLVAWVPWVAHLLLAELWLFRESRRRPTLAKAV